MTGTGAVRIISGRWRGRRLSVPSGMAVRPTSDRLRETLFNVLGPAVSGARVIDGFAGTGAIGLEALSRGAAEVRFVESDPAVRAVLVENIRRCGVEEGVEIVGGDFLDLADSGPPGRQADLIVLDPPYAYPHLEAALDVAARHLAAGGLLVLEHSRRRDPPAARGALERVRVLRSGESALSFYQPAEAGSDPT